MSAYLIVDTKIENQENYEEYKALARPIAEKYGASTRHVEGNWILSKQISGHQPG